MTGMYELELRFRAGPEADIDEFSLDALVMSALDDEVTVDSVMADEESEENEYTVHLLVQVSPEVDTDEFTLGAWLTSLVEDEVPGDLEGIEEWAVELETEEYRDQLKALTF